MFHCRSRWINRSSCLQKYSNACSPCFIFVCTLTTPAVYHFFGSLSHLAHYAQQVSLTVFSVSLKRATSRAQQRTWSLMVITLSSKAHHAKMSAVTGARNLSLICLVETSVSHYIWHHYISSSSNISLKEIILVAALLRLLLVGAIKFV